mmetsp:Transcript_77707/g.137680  ORF Transcript_77707/g.137680 Transcript_77707/m.137680 type:complete len:613 (-) Transcript_77707:57-1895(-)
MGTRMMHTLLFAVVAALASADEPRHVLYNRTSCPPTWHRLAVRIPPQELMHVMIAVKQTNLKALEEKFWAVADPKSKEWRQFMSAGDIANLVKSKPEDVEVVSRWLKKELSGEGNFQVMHDAIEVHATVQTVEKLFQGTLNVFKHDNGHHMIYRFFGPHSVPEAVYKAIDFVEGVSEFPMHRSSVNRSNPKSASGKTQLIVPQSLEQMYSIPPSSADSKVSQGPAEFVGEAAYSKNALKAFFKDLDIGGQNVSHVVGPFDSSFPGVESSLDIQYIMGVGQKQTDFYWTSDNWMYSWSHKFFNSKSIPDAVSISWGWAEDQQCSSVTAADCSVLGIDSEQYVARVNVEFQKIGLRGVSLIVCTQDSGANGKTDMECQGKKLHAAFPGSSPYVTAVGATMLTNPEFNLKDPPAACSVLGSDYACASGGTEVAVSFAEAGFTSGGGFSTYTSMPSYQKKAVNAYLTKYADKLPPTSYFNASNRAFPDISANGHNFLVNIGMGEGWMPVGGTSASTPTFAGITSYLNDLSYKKTGKPLGFLSPLLYQMHAEAPDAFTDITVGNNKCTEAGCFAFCKGYEATAGWDPVTGLGTPVADKMLSYLEKLLTEQAREKIVV